jgi:hypothetical protein
MSDINSNLTEKISETITNAFKKTKVFEKIGKIEIYIGSFIVISSIISLTSIYMNYCNMDRIKKFEDKIEGCENILKHNIEINRLKNALHHHKIIKNIKDGITISNDAQEKIIEKIMDMNLLLQNSKRQLISQATSMTALSPFKSIASNDEWKENVIHGEDIKDMEDDELLNECYDSIPLNNLKKKTNSWLI